jgi:hypothetical protein
MKVVMDSDCLVKLSKAGAKEAVASTMEISIPPLVKIETVDEAKICGFHDAFIIEENISRKLLKLGAEKYVADCYSRGEITLREAAEVLDISTRNALELFLDMGITGNLDAADTLKALSFLQNKIAAQ